MSADSNIPYVDSKYMNRQACGNYNSTTMKLKSGVQFTYGCGEDFVVFGGTEFANQTVHDFIACVESCVDYNSRSGDPKCKSASFRSSKC